MRHNTVPRCRWWRRQRQHVRRVARPTAAADTTLAAATGRRTRTYALTRAAAIDALRVPKRAAHGATCAHGGPHHNAVRRYRGTSATFASKHAPNARRQRRQVSEHGLWEHTMVLRVSTSPTRLATAPLPRQAHSGSVTVHREDKHTSDDAVSYSLLSMRGTSSDSFL
jgi:hypothetical protein